MGYNPWFIELYEKQEEGAMQQRHSRRAILCQKSRRKQAVSEAALGCCMFTIKQINTKRGVALARYIYGYIGYVDLNEPG